MIERNGRVAQRPERGLSQTAARCHYANFGIIKAFLNIHTLRVENNSRSGVWATRPNGKAAVDLAALRPCVPPTMPSLTGLDLYFSFLLQIWRSYGTVPLQTILLALAWLGLAGHAFAQGGTVVGWGNNYYGQTTVPFGLSNVVALAGAEYYSLALKADGTVVAWGDSRYTDVPSGLSNVVAIAAGKYHSLALIQNSPPFSPLSNPVRTSNSMPCNSRTLWRTRTGQPCR
jgi:hypothetical protein